MKYPSETGSKYIGSVKYGKIQNGGYIAYTDTLVMYIPGGIDLKDVQMIASALAWNPKYMTFEEAKQYVPYL